ncbi:MAG TPA: transposase [Rhodocyclaceae bacterium]|nr:transposase [Rhodocyclaceae bacterium]HRQ47490.1 transposase [Rhodocyclaceae bacterium]
MEGNRGQSTVFRPCFFTDEDYRRYLDWLTEYADKTHCRIHAYVLMTNHVHLQRATVGRVPCRVRPSAICPVFVHRHQIRLKP